MNELENIVASQFGSLLLTNAKLSAQISELNNQINDLKKDKESLKAQKTPSDAPDEK